MLDDILEIALEIGGEVLEAVIRGRRKRRKASCQAKKEARRVRKEEKKSLAGKRREPWKERKSKLPWEGW